MKYRFAIKSGGLYSPSFALSKSSSGVYLSLRDPLLYEKRSVHFDNDIMHDKRHLYRGFHKGSHNKRMYEVGGGSSGGRLTPECSYILGRFSLVATEEEFHRRKNSNKVEVFERSIEDNDIVTIHLVSTSIGHAVECPSSFEIVREVTEGPQKWMVVLEHKSVSSVYDMVARSVRSNANAVFHGSESKGKFEHIVLVSDLHEDYRPQRNAQMSVVIANRDFEVYVESGQLKIRGYIVRK